MGPIGPALALACRIVLAFVLACAAAAKIADRHDLPERLRSMGMAPRVATVVAPGLPTAEIVVAVALVALPHSWLPAAAAFVLLVAFTIFLLATARSAVPCPCFGAVRTAQIVSTPTAVLRNGVLLALAVLSTGSIDGARAGGTVAASVVVVLGALLAVARVA